MRAGFLPARIGKDSNENINTWYCCFIPNLPACPVYITEYAPDTLLQFY